MTNPIKKYGMLIRPLLDDSDERKRIIKISTMVNGISEEYSTKFTKKCNFKVHHYHQSHQLRQRAQFHED